MFDTSFVFFLFDWQIIVLSVTFVCLILSFILFVVLCVFDTSFVIYIVKCDWHIVCTLSCSLCFTHILYYLLFHAVDTCLVLCVVCMLLTYLLFYAFDTSFIISIVLILSDTSFVLSVVFMCLAHLFYFLLFSCVWHILGIICWFYAVDISFGVSVVFMSLTHVWHILGFICWFYAVDISFVLCVWHIFNQFYCVFLIYLTHHCTLCCFWWFTILV